MGKASKGEERQRHKAAEKERKLFMQPPSIESAEDSIRSCQAEIVKLEDDLRNHREEAQRHGMTDDGRRWRGKAKWALERKTARLRLLKDWVGVERNRVRAGSIDGVPLDPRNPDSLIRSAFVLLRDWARQRPQVSSQEWAVINALEGYTLK